jgi:phosphate transport system permease protein
MIWIALLALLAFSFGLSALARRKAVRGGARPHSLPGYYSAFAWLWAFVPAFLVLVALMLFGGRAETALLAADLPAAAQTMPAERVELFLSDAQGLARGEEPLGEYSAAERAALAETAREAASFRQTVYGSALALAAVLALGLGLFAYVRVRPDLRARQSVEGWVGGVLTLCSAVAVLTTLGIVLSLVWESLRFFAAVSPLEFLTGLQWSPQIAIRADQVGQSGAFGAVPLFVGTFLIMFIAMLVAGPVGLFSAIYLAEYASRPVRNWIKPLLEILAGVPTVVYGFFAALTVGPAFRWFFNSIGAQLAGGPLDGLGQYLMQVQNQMALVAGFVMGIMLIPFVSSLSDDIINAVPQSLRDGSYAMGATKSETVKKVVLPAALPGIAGAFLLAISRAVGETMIVTMAAGLQARATINPLETVTTVTVQIVTLLTGDQEFDSPKTLAAFGLGLTLFVVTLILNVIALRVVQHYREQYD